MEPCNHLPRIEALEKREAILFEALKKMEDKFDSKLDLILFQISKIAVLEANHQNQQSSIQRAFSKLDDLEEASRIQEAFRNKTEGMAKMAWVLWTMLGVSVAGLIAKVM